MEQGVNVTRWLVVAAIVVLAVFVGIALYTFVFDYLLARLVNLLT